MFELLVFVLKLAHFAVRYKKCFLSKQSTCTSCFHTYTGTTEHSDRCNKDVSLQLCLLHASITVDSSSHTETPPTFYDIVAKECKLENIIRRMNVHMYKVGIM